ncbi:MAG TPA: glycosyltransferase family 1 protein [Noviherbaspirillum sp.]|uniref:glycosyltransferase family 4 protein n=1 Tax=Noviherbaspirillum sp. TaxID=1926288 RepID=UPI002D49EFBA|nr:glycosyltransferase family 1 protein [Noviherbaspirillum sp.]HYD96516.1 glycosyltransferase family 1 protein [Noviherbaspirillum sp.]
MQEILIDVTRLLRRFITGRPPAMADRISREYVRHYAPRANAVIRLRGRSVVLPRQASRLLYAQLLNPASGSRAAAVLTVGKEVLCARQRCGLEGAFLFNTGHAGPEQRCHPNDLDRLGVKQMFFVPDLIPVTHPEYCRPGERDKHVARLNGMLAGAAGMITQSQATLDELAGFASKTGAAMPPAAVLPAPALLPAPASRPPLAKPYFVVLGTIEARKNHWLLLQAWRRLQQRMGRRTPRLLVIGRRGRECENVADLLDRCASLRSVVTELPHCSERDLSTYLRHARALLFPSFAEGDGMPLTEALQLGTPVIASDLPVFREIAGDVPDYLDPLDGTGWAERIEAYSDAAFPRRVAQIERSRALALPTWGQHFERIDAFLETLQ